MIKKYTPIGINAILFIVVLFLNLNIKPVHERWIAFHDAFSYLEHSKVDVFSSEFFFPEGEKFAARPFSVPLFYKMCNSNPETILKAQKIAHAIAAFILIAALLLFINNHIIKYLLMFLIYVLMSWWNILGWSNLLLSESISMSLFFIWIASLLFLIKKRTLLSLVVHSVCVILFSFTRDSWPYVLLLTYVMLTIASFKYGKELKWKFSGLIGFALAIFFLQQHSANVGHRYRLPVMNNIVVKILPNATYTKWFVDEGMPMSKRLLSEYPESSDANRSLYSLYGDSTYQEFFDWVDEKGKNTYTKFLVTHLEFSSLINEDPEMFNRFFAYNLQYANFMQGHCRLAHNIFPLFRTWHLLLLVVISLACFYTDRKFIYLIPLLFTVICFFNAFLLYNADALEVERHLFITQIFMEIIGLFSLALYLDSTFFSAQIQLFRSKIKTKKSISVRRD